MMRWNRFGRTIKYYYKYWKIGVHLIFRTYHFGVNNKWWEKFPSKFGLPIRQRFSIKQLKENYILLDIRASACGWMSIEEYETVFFWKTHYMNEKKNG